MCNPTHCKGSENSNSASLNWQNGVGVRFLKQGQVRAKTAREYPMMRSGVGEARCGFCTGHLFACFIACFYSLVCILCTTILAAGI